MLLGVLGEIDRVDKWRNCVRYCQAFEVDPVNDDRRRRAARRAQVVDRRVVAERELLVVMFAFAAFLINGPNGPREFASRDPMTLLDQGDERR